MERVIRLVDGDVHNLSNSRDDVTFGQDASRVAFYIEFLRKGNIFKDQISQKPLRCVSVANFFLATRDFLSVRVSVTW